MDDQDPIKQLQSLLTDRREVLERISGIHALLDSIKAAESSTGNNNEVIPSAASAAAVPNEEPYDRVLHVLRDMQSQLANQVRPLAQQAIHFQVERLRERAAMDQAEMRNCLQRIDQYLCACIERAREYQWQHGELARYNGRLAALGATPEPLPECSANVNELIDSRMELLRRQHKI